MTWRSVGISLVIVGSFMVGCDDGVAPPAENPQPGWLALRLSTPSRGADALLFRITGGPIDSVVSQDHTLFCSEAVQNDWRVLLVGSLEGGVVARFWVPNPAAIGRYDAVIQQAVAEQGFEQQPVSGYAMTIEAPGRH